jgi:hypothetical protein
MWLTCSDKPRLLNLATSIDSKTGRRLDRKADFTLSYSHEASDLSDLYARLLLRISAVSHVWDAFTKLGR